MWVVSSLLTILHWLKTFMYQRMFMADITWLVAQFWIMMHLGIYGLVAGNTQTHHPQVGAEIKVTYNMLVQNKIRGVGTTADHTGFCGAARKKCTHTSPHQGSEHRNEWLPAERVVGEFLPPNPGHHIFRTSKSKVVSCTFQHPTGYRSHQKLHVFETLIWYSNFLGSTPSDSSD